jgi:hypothetical protein
MSRQAIPFFASGLTFAFGCLALQSYVHHRSPTPPDADIGRTVFFKWWNLVQFGALICLGLCLIGLGRSADSPRAHTLYKMAGWACFGIALVGSGGLWKRYIDALLDLTRLRPGMRTAV